MSKEPKVSFPAYRNALRTLAARTGTPLPSLILSFGILHEATAVAPLIGVFYASRSLRIGEHVVNAVVHDEPPSNLAAINWGRVKLKGWIHEGDEWASRVGRRYGIFGYEKGSAKLMDNDTEEADKSDHTYHISGDVANAVVAYGVTKVAISCSVS